MMLELIAHLLGDFALQNQWMAANKLRSSVACLVHVLFYGLPFVVLMYATPPLARWLGIYFPTLPASLWALGVICSTHFVIDRFALAKQWTAFWGVGEPGWVLTRIRRHFADLEYRAAVRAYRQAHPNNPDGPRTWMESINEAGRCLESYRAGSDAEKAYLANHPLPELAPAFLGVWLGIIVDNTFHLLINHLAFHWLG